MLQLSVGILNGPGKSCEGIMIPNATNSSFRCQMVVYPEEEKTGSNDLLDLRLKSASEQMIR